MHPDQTHEPLTPDRAPPESGVRLVKEPPADVAKGPSVKVRVATWTQINHAGRLYRGGETFRAPRLLVDAWIAAGWAEPAGR